MLDMPDILAMTAKGFVRSLGFIFLPVAILIWLLSWLVYSFSGKFNWVNALDIETAGLYWHFVDIVWIVIFTAVYLVEYI